MGTEKVKLFTLGNDFNGEYMKRKCSKFRVKLNKSSFQNKGNVLRECSTEGGKRNRKSLLQLQPAFVL